MLNEAESDRHSAATLDAISAGPPAWTGKRAPWSALAILLATFGLAYVMFRPVSHNLVLYSALAALGVLALIVILRTRPYVSAELWSIGALSAGLAIYGTLVGYDNPGLLFTFLIYFAAPTLFFALVLACSFDALRWFFWAAAGVTLALSLLIVLFVYGEAGTVPQLIPEWLQEQTGLGATFRGDASQARAYGLSSLAALGPLWMGSLVVKRDALLPHWSIRLLCALAAAAAAFVSSRMAILLVIAIAPVLAITARAVIRPRPFVARRYRPRSIALVTLGAAAASVGAIFVMPRILAFSPLVTLSHAVNSFFTGRTDVGDADQSIRSDQAAQLLDAWANNPIFGVGFGARVPDYARTSERPWVLELQYHLFLFNTGLVGVIFALAIGVCAFIMFRRAARTLPQLLSTLSVAVTAGIAMLIANATNPYLQAPGHFWPIFLALAVANLMLEAGRRPGGALVAAPSGTSR